MLTVGDEFGGDFVPVEASVFSEDPVSDDPGNHREIDDAEFFAEEIGAADLVDIASEILDPLLEGNSLKLLSLRMEDAEIAWDDELVDEIDPDPGLCGLVGIGRSQVGLVFGIGIFEEFENDVRVVKGLGLIGECRDQTLWIES